MSFTLAGAVAVNQIIHGVKAHSNVQTCLFILGRWGGPPQLVLVCLVWFRVQIRSRLLRCLCCVVVKAASLCNTCARVFVVFGPQPCTFDYVWFIAVWMLRFFLFFFCCKAGADLINCATCSTGLLVVVAGFHILNEANWPCSSTL